MEVVNAKDFMALLKENDMVIVSRKDLGIDQQIEINLVRERIKKQGYGNLQDMINAKWFRVKTTHGLNHWIKAGKIRPEELYINKKGKVHILFEAVEFINRRA
ncbi:hypothetical protein [Flavobacterium sp. NKUCC04_CG]|uniref:hypothetical protein n=1 Tax=Flavobacterium sp. NKUCC04_CG TaxID=2842121 RepID=UPI001C5AA201|nr:hypothetical protein [Flavobacterium sp. NKUCC04_CG]MBW3518324.1 hypothetical protein [Flavobacterium sp. NKUCC04_CG]